MKKKMDYSIYFLLIRSILFSIFFTFFGTSSFMTFYRLKAYCSCKVKKSLAGCAPLSRSAQQIGFTIFRILMILIAAVTVSSVTVCTAMRNIITQIVINRRNGFLFFISVTFSFFRCFPISTVCVYLVSIIKEKLGENPLELAWNPGQKCSKTVAAL